MKPLHVHTERLSESSYSATVQKNGVGRSENLEADQMFLRIRAKYEQKNTIFLWSISNNVLILNLHLSDILYLFTFFYLLIFIYFYIYLIN